MKWVTLPLLLLTQTNNALSATLSSAANGTGTGTGSDNSSDNTTVTHPPLNPHYAEDLARQDTVDNLLFNVTLAEFETARDRRDPYYMNWESDSCTHSSDKPFGWDFGPACHRHDFGVYNYKRQGRFDTWRKDLIDRNFFNDMLEQCKPHKAVSKFLCNGAAYLYFRAVKKFSG